MKAIFILPAITLNLLIMSCQQIETFDDEGQKAQDEQLSGEALSEQELNHLLLMREEEKLARDVYSTLYTRWQTNVLKNIGLSEQQHMEALLTLINKYELTDPVGSNEIGIFSNADLQKLYHQLVASGDSSLLGAYKVGATIEDMDLFDLEEALLISEHGDVNETYDALCRGSRNHMRAFHAQIIAMGGTYVTQYISQEQLDSIINTNRESGMIDEF